MNKAKHIAWILIFSNLPFSCSRSPSPVVQFNVILINAQPWHQNCSYNMFEQFFSVSCRHWSLSTKINCQTLTSLPKKKLLYAMPTSWCLLVTSKKRQLHILDLFFISFIRKKYVYLNPLHF